MKVNKLIALIAACFFAFASPVVYGDVYVDSGDGGPGVGNSGDSGVTVMSLPSVSGELEKLPKELTGGEYRCGEYFAGRPDNNPDAIVTFALKKKEVDVGGKKTDVAIILIMTKKNISVVRDDKRTVPFATVKLIEGRKQVEVKVSTAVMRKATCLPKPRGWKGA